MLRTVLLCAIFVTAAAAQPPELCRKYEGAYISYYEHVFLVKGCRRHALTSQQKIYNLTRRGVVFRTVDAEVIRGIPLADAPATRREPQVSSRQLCRSLQGRYITRSYVDIYLVDRCRKHLFPNWEAYQDHVRQRGKQGEAIVSVSRQEFKAIKTGKDMPSSQRTSLSVLPDIDVIPRAAACRGVEGKYVSYYTKVYYVEDCQRHPVPETKVRSGKLNIDRELTSEQWLSLPRARS